MKTNILALRRDRRILRSKVYLLLKDSVDEENPLEKLQARLNEKELEDVIEDTIYFIPFSDKRRTIIQNLKTVEQLVDNVNPSIQVRKSDVFQRSFKKRPTILLPKERHESFLSQFSKINFRLNNSKSQMPIKQIGNLNQMINRLNCQSGFLKEVPVKKANTNISNAYKKFFTEFCEISSNFHETMKIKYKAKVKAKDKRKSIYKIRESVLEANYFQSTTKFKKL